MDRIQTHFSRHSDKTTWHDKTIVVWNIKVLEHYSCRYAPRSLIACVQFMIKRAEEKNKTVPTIRAREEKNLDVENIGRGEKVSESFP